MSFSGAFLFGSRARGDCDESSDIDVLAVYGDSPDIALREKVHRAAHGIFDGNVVVAEYSKLRLNEFFAQGHLFAWHLFQEASPLNISLAHDEVPYFFSRPAPYITGSTDARKFHDLLVSIHDELKNSPGSLVHEAGLTYLALRNIAMSISPGILPTIDFTRYSPFSVSDCLEIAPPCEHSEYVSLVAARHASQRGSVAPEISNETLQRLLDQALIWTEKVLGVANEKH